MADDWEAEDDWENVGDSPAPKKEAPAAKSAATNDDEDSGDDWENDDDATPAFVPKKKVVGDWDDESDEDEADANKATASNDKEKPAQSAKSKKKDMERKLREKEKAAMDPDEIALDDPVLEKQRLQRLQLKADAAMFGDFGEFSIKDNTEKSAPATPSGNIKKKKPKIEVVTVDAFDKTKFTTVKELMAFIEEFAKKLDASKVKDCYQVVLQRLIKVGEAKLELTDMQNLHEEMKKQVKEKKLTKTTKAQAKSDKNMKVDKNTKFNIQDEMDDVDGYDEADWDDWDGEGGDWDGNWDGNWEG